MSEEELEDLKWQQTEYEENIIGELVKENEQLKSQLQQKDNIIKEVREFIETYNKVIRENKMVEEYANIMTIPEELLLILDKENKDE